MPSRPRRSAIIRLPIAGAALLSLLACRSTAEPSRACQQTYEFGNSGCLEVTGQVVGLRGQPLRGISVVAKVASDRIMFAGGGATTDSTGAFAIRAARMAGDRPAMGPDTLSVWIVGADPATAGVSVPARVRDSILVQATLSPVGDIPTPSVVRLMLPAP